MGYWATEKQSAFVSALAVSHPKTIKEAFELHAPTKNEKALLRGTEAARIIAQTESLISKRTSSRRMSKRAIVGDCLYHSKGDKPAAFANLVANIGPGYLGTHPLVFQKNVKGGKREDLPMPVQREQLQSLIDEMHTKMNFQGGEQKQEQKGEEKDNEPEEERKPGQDLLEFIREARTFCKQRKTDGKPLDEIGLRPAEYGAKMLSAGLPIDAIKHAMTMHWPKEARSAMKVKDYDVAKFRKKDRKEGYHAAFPYIKAIATEAKIPVCLAGPKGTGKTTLAMQLAEVLDLPFGMVSMTSGTSPSAFNGRPKIGGDGGVVESQFVKIYRNGGVWLFDEMDAADENLLLLVNAALANRVFFNAATGEKIVQHLDFIPMAGMNTLGLGAGRDYGARNKLDAATLDRWNMGRVWVDLDESVEDSIFYGIMGENKETAK